MVIKFKLKMKGVTIFAISIERSLCATFVESSPVSVPTMVQLVLITREGWRKQHSPESLLRAADYFTSDLESTEDRIFERRALNVDSFTPEEGLEFSAQSTPSLPTPNATRGSTTTWENFTQGNPMMNRRDGIPTEFFVRALKSMEWKIFLEC